MRDVLLYIILRILQEASVKFASCPATGADRIRTGDLLVANQSLSRLSYGPGETGAAGPAGSPNAALGPVGFEPTTSPLSGVRSNQLSYGPLRAAGKPCRPAKPPPISPLRTKKHSTVPAEHVNRARTGAATPPRRFACQERRVTAGARTGPGGAGCRSDTGRCNRKKSRRSPGRHACREALGRRG
jgi:hypothetical protein